MDITHEETYHVVVGAVHALYLHHRILEGEILHYCTLGTGTTDGAEQTVAILVVDIRRVVGTPYHDLHVADGVTITIEHSLKTLVASLTEYPLTTVVTVEVDVGGQLEVAVEVVAASEDMTGKVTQRGKLVGTVDDIRVSLGTCT